MDDDAIRRICDGTNAKEFREGLLDGGCPGLATILAENEDEFDLMCDWAEEAGLMNCNQNSTARHFRCANSRLACEHLLQRFVAREE
eukprot:3675529-Prymnesium_polylepis.1